MLGLTSTTHPQFPIPFPNQTIPKSIQFHPLHYQISPLKYHRKISLWRRRRGPNASENGGGGGEKVPDGEGKNGRTRFNLKWLDLIVDKDPDNIVAVALTGVIAWASLRVLSQLVFISAAILVAAIKYSFIAALLIFILITLL